MIKLHSETKTPHVYKYVYYYCEIIITKKYKLIFLN